MNTELMQHTASVAAAFLGNNTVPTADVAAVISSIHVSFKQLAELGTIPVKPVAAVPVKKSITPDYLICIEDGKKLKMLKRHLKTAFNLTPDEYRAKWGLPADYPMVAPNYAKRRSVLAKHIGLGTRPRSRKAK